MAIVIEEEKNRSNIVRIFLWLLILAVVAVAGYYIFFAEPELVEIVAPPNLESKNISSLNRIDLSPGDVIGNAEFKSLKQYVNPPQPGNAGKSNPFAP